MIDFCHFQQYFSYIMAMSYELFPHVSKMPILTDERANSVTVNNLMILNITHNIFNLDDTEVLIYIRSVILKRVDSPNHQVVYSNTVRPFICEDWHFTHMWK
jgi:hypothetical protein